MDYLNHVKQQIISERILVFLNLKKKKNSYSATEKVKLPLRNGKGLEGYNRP